MIAATLNKIREGADLLPQSESVQAKINKTHVSFDPLDIDNFEEAILNLRPDDIKTYLACCVIVESISKDADPVYVLTCQALCHKYLMKCMHVYWIEAEISNRHPSLDGDC